MLSLCTWRRRPDHAWRLSTQKGYLFAEANIAAIFDASMRWHRAGNLSP
jgi:hypothetical protein